MGLFDAFRFDGKRAVVVGGATGMGAATAELAKDAGAEVVVMDRAEVTLDGVKAIHLDLSDTASIDAAVDECGGPIHALFSCAGVAEGTPGIEKINFLGHRYMIDRLLERDLLPRGSAIGMISSAAGMGWEASLESNLELLAIDDVEAAGIDAATPLEQAYPLLFLCSDAAAGITGITMMTDAGFYGSGVSGSFPSATEAVKFLRGDYGPL